MNETTPTQSIPLDRLRQRPGKQKPEPELRSPPDFSRALHALEYQYPIYRNPENGEFIIGIYRDDKGGAVPILLYADPKIDYFWDVARACHGAPPLFYLRMPVQPEFDMSKGRPVLRVQAWSDLGKPEHSQPE